MGSSSVFSIVVLSCWISTSFAYLLEINPQVLEDRLDDIIVYGLRHKDMQAYIDNITFDKIPLEGDDLLESLAEHYETEFGKRINAIKRLRKAAQESYSKTTAFYPQCCETDPSTVEYNPLFKTSVSTKRVCDRVSSSATSSSVRLSSSAFQDAALENFDIIPTLKWQYFGSREGVTTAFPTSVPSDCSTYDNRLRPWYAQAAVPHSKQVVIVIDCSGSMAELYQGVPLFELVKEAAKSIIETLNPYDMFAVVAASDRQKTLSDFSDYGICFSRNLAHATPKSKREINLFIDSIVPSGGTYYVGSLDRAFSFFAEEADAGDVGHSHGDEESDKIMHFISDGLPNDSPDEIILKLKKLHNDSEHEVLLMTYGVGLGDFKILNDLALVHPHHHKRGEFTHITSRTELRNRMGQHYKLYLDEGVEVTEPIWSVPYLDDFGIGQVTTASLPVYINGSLVGVVAIEVALEDLFAKSTYFSPNEFTYSFIIENTGLLLNHPLFPYVDDRDSLYVYASAFERDDDFGGVFHDMQEGHDGVASFYSTKITTHGDSKTYGVGSKRVFANYFWKKINSTIFAICVVTVGDVIEVLPSQGGLHHSSLLYHRFDLVAPEEPCEHLSLLSAMNHSALVLAPRAFSDPNYFINHVMTKSEVEQINNYIQGKGNNTQNIKEGIKDQIIVAHHAQDFWLRPDENVNMKKDIAWMYVATRDGVFHVFPGRSYPVNFDPTQRPWYKQALAHRDRTSVVTYPHLDAGTGIVVITLSKVLYYGNSSGVHDHNTNEVFGVMGVDIIVSHFNTLFINMYPLCKDAERFRCLLIDLAGTVLVTNEVGTDYIRIKEFNEKYDWETHLTKLEPEMSSVLIRDNVLHRINCSNIEAGLFQRMYLISQDQKEYRGIYKKNFFNVFVFQLIPVPNTNVYILVKFLSESTCGNYFFTCPCSSMGCTTNGTEEGNCECPCATVNPHYFSCENEYTDDATTPCTSQHKHAADSTVQRVDQTAYPKCYTTAFTFQDVAANDNIAIILPGSITGVLLFLGIALLLYNFPMLTTAWKDDETGKSVKNKHRPVITPHHTISKESFDLHFKDLERFKGKTDSKISTESREEFLLAITTRSGSNISDDTLPAHGSRSEKSNLYLPGNAMSFLSNRSIMDLANEANIAGTTHNSPSANEQLKQPTPESSDDDMPYVHGSNTNSGAPNRSDLSDSSVSGLVIKSSTNLSNSSSYASLPDNFPQIGPRANSLHPEKIKLIKDLKTRNMSLPGRFSRIPFRAVDLVDVNTKKLNKPSSDFKSSKAKTSSVEKSSGFKEEAKRYYALKDIQPAEQSEKKNTSQPNPLPKPTQEKRDEVDAREYEFVDQSGSGYFQDLYDVFEDKTDTNKTNRTATGQIKQLPKSSNAGAIRDDTQSGQNVSPGSSKMKADSPTSSYMQGVNSRRNERHHSLQIEISQNSAKQRKISLPGNRQIISSDERKRLAKISKDA